MARDTSNQYRQGQKVGRRPADNYVIMHDNIPIMEMVGVLLWREDEQIQRQLFGTMGPS